MNQEERLCPVCEIRTKEPGNYMCEDCYRSIQWDEAKIHEWGIERVGTVKKRR
jgi:NMD protein affecting ribosome stability and mRNA decay